jgi:hypothetical protein
MTGGAARSRVKDKKWTGFRGLRRLKPEKNHVNPVNPVYSGPTLRAFS